MRKELLTPEIIKMAKSLKRQIVEITPHFICGSDSNMATFSIIYLNGSVQVDDDLYYFGAASELAKYELYSQNKYAYEMLKPRMQYLRYTCQHIDNNRLLFQYDNVTKESGYCMPGFIESLNAKAKDGSRFIYDNDCAEYIMSSCSTMHPINKSDIVSVYAWEYTPITFMVRFDIDKKKYAIHEYVSFLYL